MLPGVSKYCITLVCGDVPCSVVTTRLTPLQSSTGRVCAVDAGTLLGGARRQYWSPTSQLSPPRTEERERMVHKCYQDFATWQQGNYEEDIKFKKYRWLVVEIFT